MVKHILIIDAHPDPSAGRFVHALSNAYAEGAEQAGHQVHRIRLAELDFPLLHSTKEWRGVAPEAIAQAQAAIRWAHHIVILYPLWLGDMPALLKGFLEQVMRPGFALDERANPMRAGLLKGRSARLVVTMGMPALVYRFYFGAHSLRSLKRNVLRMVGIGPIKDTIIGRVDGDAANLSWHLKTMRKLGAAGD